MKNHVASTAKRFALAAFCLALVGGTQQAGAVTVPTPSTSSCTSYVRVSWARVRSAKRYYVYRATSASLSRASRIRSTTSTVIYDTSATPGVNYYYWVCPVVGRYYYYNGRKYRVGWRQVAVPRPYASISYTSYVRLSWSSSRGARYYRIRRGTSTRYASSSWLARTSSTYYYDTSARAGVTYYYWIVPYGRNGRGWYNTSKYDYGRRKGSSSSLTVPQPTGTAYSGYNYIRWNTTSGAVKFNLYRSTSSSVNPNTGAKKIASGTTSSAYTYYYYYDTSVSSGTAYYYWVCPVDSRGTEWYNASKWVRLTPY